MEEERTTLSDEEIVTARPGSPDRAQVVDADEDDADTGDADSDGQDTDDADSDSDGHDDS